MEKLNDPTSGSEDVHGLWKCNTELYPNTGFHQSFISITQMHGVVKKKTDEFNQDNKTLKYSQHEEERRRGAGGFQE